MEKTYGKYHGVGSNRVSVRREFKRRATRLVWLRQTQLPHRVQRVGRIHPRPTALNLAQTRGQAWTRSRPRPSPMVQALLRRVGLVQREASPCRSASVSVRSLNQNLLESRMREIRLSGLAGGVGFVSVPTLTFLKSSACFEDGAQRVSAGSGFTRSPRVRRARGTRGRRRRCKSGDRGRRNGVPWRCRRFGGRSRVCPSGRTIGRGR